MVSFFSLLLVHKQFVGGILKLCKHPVSHKRLFETALLIHIFKVHHLMSFDICLQLWKHPHNHASKPICHLPTFPLFLSCHPYFSSFLTLFLSAGNHWRLFCHHRIIYVFWNFVRWTIRSLSPPPSLSRPLWPGFCHYDNSEIPPWCVCQQPTSLLIHTPPFYAEFTVSMPWLGLIDSFIHFFKTLYKRHSFVFHSSGAWEVQDQDDWLFGEGCFLLSQVPSCCYF